jgi:hypothetical protein
MHHLLAVIMMSAAAPFSNVALGYEPTAAPTGDEPAASAGDSSAAPAATERGAPSGPDAWRYRRQDGLWWYWLPSDSWVYWTDGKWVPYDQKTYAEFKASRRPQQQTRSAQSYSRDGTWGQWGPIHYDRYGNPQYPYSQRTKGMRQLGPVPTPGGVRSLPGWGGER